MRNDFLKHELQGAVLPSEGNVPDLIDKMINLVFQEVWYLSPGGRGKHSMDTFKVETSIFVQTKLIIRGFPRTVTQSWSRLEKYVKIVMEK
jgi:hypothetical protein